MEEFLLSTNKYKKPYRLTNNDALSVLLIRLLTMEPGTHPLHPEMGVGIIARYRYCTADDLQQLQKEIQNQIEVYLPDYEEVDVETTFVKGSKVNAIRVTITIDGTLFNFTTAKTEDASDILLTSDTY